MFTAYILYETEGKVISYTPSREYAQAMVDAPLGSVKCTCTPYANSYRVKVAASTSAGYAWDTTDKQTKSVMKALMLLHGININQGV